MTIKAVAKFDVKEHFELFEKHEMIFCKSENASSNRSRLKCNSVVDMIKMVLFYPLYCFAYISSTAKRT